MRLVLITLLCVAIFSSCRQSEPRPLSKDKMALLMTDIHLSEVYGTMVNDSLHKSLNRNMDSVAVYYKSILAHHDVTIEDFKKSLQWYSDHPSEFDSVYIDVQNEIVQLESTINGGG